ncbi:MULTISPECIES: sodium-dependent transporter [Sporosarcina]|uniref:Neurotransmitter:Na+ symporter, NSS family n=2 Tax=Sporosarcina newyorkensis TaxID=759851 RepID=A0A1T4YXD0_9BACL|nr:MULTISPECIES: sodium-dependent transporter [Sporosarcina]EGQ24096.1 neurotransmitter:Na+ symporter [Sporosarcina newyorkensis 2681]MBY0223463.1 sodium-dependent transporter [Sporosarcina aquimarina]SKB06459.1 neurotransmitter:Na+ symporter, NSS family [Sporosarcina newyorkensis]
MKQREQWTSKIGFILAAAGSAIGLGAIWKFPYMAGTNGGSVFVLLFIICTLLIGLPILLAEFVIGRRGQADAVTSLKKLSTGRNWAWVGWMGLASSFIILSFYSVVGGWILSYLARAFTFNLGELDYGELFDSIIANPVEVLLAQALFMGLTIWIVQSGIRGGIERASRWIMPLLFLSFIVLAIRSLTLEGAMEGVRFLFVPDWSYFNGTTFLVALGQAFFSLSVGVTAMMTYASYLSKEEKLGQSAFNVSILNIGISILAGLVIFPAVFALGHSPAAGPGLIFVILPAIFNEIPFGAVFLIIFFLLMLFATITSSIAMLEIVVSTGIRNKHDRRRRASWVFGGLIFLVGIPSALSFGLLSDVNVFGNTIFDFADLLTSRIAMPIGALAVSLFAGFILTKEDTAEELRMNSALHSLWKVIVRYFAPLAIVVIFFSWIFGM